MWVCLHLWSYPHANGLLCFLFKTSEDLIEMVGEVVLAHLQLLASWKKSLPLSYLNKN